VVYLNDGSGNLAAGSEDFGTGSDATFAVALGDVDGDGDLDVAVGNSGQQNAGYLNQTSPIIETTPAAGLSGEVLMPPGGEAQVFSIGLTGDGTESVNSIAVTLSDLSPATGLAQSDFTELRAYASTDAVLDEEDTQIGTLTQASINIGSASTISTGANVPLAGTERFYLVTAVIGPAAVTGHAFRVGFAIGGATTSIGGLGTVVTASDANQVTITPSLSETTTAAGLSGEVTANPGGEVQVFSIGLIGDGTESVNSIAVTLSDLSTATGIDTSDFLELRLYRSLDASLDSGDTLVVSLPADSIEIGSATTLTPASPNVPPTGAERFYLVATRIDTTVTDGHAFKVGFAAGGVATSAGGLGAAVAAGDANKVTIDVTGARLVFTTAPADTGVADAANDEVVSGKAFPTQPVLVAQDAYGNVDQDFTEILTVSLSSGSGSLEGALKKVVVNGKADFAGNALKYTAASDGEGFSLNVDDEAGGSDLAAGTISLSADVVATRLAFVQEPDPLAEPGVNFASSPVQVAAQDESGLTDADYGTPMALKGVAVEDTSITVDSLRIAPADTVAPSSGVAAWTELILPEADLIRLKATSGSLIPGLSSLVGIPGGLTAGGASPLVPKNALAGLAGAGGSDIVLNAFQLRAEGEGVPVLSIDVKPVFSGMESEELRYLDVVLDGNGNGLIDSADVSVLAAAVDDSGSGVVRTLAFSEHTAPADSLQYYLVVADLDHTVRSRDALQMDIAGLSAGPGVATGAPPMVPVSEIAGRNHVITGHVEISQVILENPKPSQTGKVTIVFDTVSDLATGEEVVIDFPVGFDPSGAGVDAGTATPSGVDPTKSEEESSGRTVVLDVGAGETRGRYTLVLDGVRNPSAAQGAVALDVKTQTDDDVELDADDPTPPGFELVGVGRVEVTGVALEQVGVGHRGKVAIGFTTATALVPGDEIELTFPGGFELSQAAVDAGTETPSGVNPEKNAAESTGQTLVLDLQADETAGGFSIALAGVVNPAAAQKDLAVQVRTRRDDDTAVDLEDADPARFEVVGSLILSQGRALDNALAGLAGSGGSAVPLASFRLTAAGEGIGVNGVALRASFGGMGTEAVGHFDVIRDEDADGAVDAGEGSVTAAAVDDGGEGEVFALEFAAEAVGADSSRHYLVVADLASTIGSTDQIQVDVVRVLAGKGAVTGSEPVLQGGPLAGTKHGVTGSTEITAVELENPQAGGRGQVAVSFTALSALAAGDEIIVAFPAGFDLSLAAVDTATVTPGGAGLQKDPSRSSRRVLVVVLGGDEDPGPYRLVLQGVVNSASAQEGLTVEVSTRRSDGTPVDGDDPTPATFRLLRASSDGCAGDFNGDGEVEFADFFLFADGFDTATEVFDLDSSGWVDFQDLFIFADRFGTVCDTSGSGGVEPGPPLDVEITAELPGGAAMDFVLIRAGGFAMGSPVDEEGRDADEGPEHEVTISRPFYLGQHEVTQAQWEAVMGTRPWAGKPAVDEESGHPAVYLSWDDAQGFVRRLNEAAGNSLYRLPTEAEWEYAARAGTTTRWSFGDEESRLADYAWVRRTPLVVSELTTHPVGVKRPNPWDLYDVHGNAGEWVQDLYGPYSGASQNDPAGPDSGSSRVVRGGGGTLSAAEVRSASREAFPPAARLSTFGLRLVRRIP